MDFTNVKQILRDEKDNAEKSKNEIRRIVSTYSSDLDNVMSEINRKIDPNKNLSTEDLSSEEIQNYCVYITGLLYYIASGYEDVGLRMDLISNKKKEVYNQALLISSGTQQDKKANAELAITDYSTIEVIYKRAHKLLRDKMDSADKMYNALKKVLTKRISESDLNRESSKITA